MKKNQFTMYWGFKGIFLLGLLITFCFSCKKEEPQINHPLVKNDGITFHDGRLIFKDDSTFINHVRWLFENQNKQQLIAEKNKSFGLKSMTEIYFEGMKLEETDPLFLAYVDKYPNIFNKQVYDNSTSYMLPHSMILCYVANKDGIYQVGDKIRRISNNYIFQISASNESKIKLLLLPKDQITDKDVKFILSVSDAKNDWAQRTRYFSNSNYRMVSSLNARLDGIIFYYDIITNPQQKKFLGIWGRAQLPTKAAYGLGWWYTIFDPSSEQPIPPENNENVGLSQISILMSLYPMDYATSYCPAYSRGQYNGETIYIYWEDALENPAIYSEPEWSPETEPF